MLAQLNGSADGLVNDPQRRKLYWINGIKYVTLLYYVCMLRLSSPVYAYRVLFIY